MALTKDGSKKCFERMKSRGTMNIRRGIDVFKKTWDENIMISCTTKECASLSIVFYDIPSNELCRPLTLEARKGKSPWLEEMEEPMSLSPWGHDHELCEGCSKGPRCHWGLLSTQAACGVAN